MIAECIPNRRASVPTMPSFGFLRSGPFRSLAAPFDPQRFRFRFERLSLREASGVSDSPPNFADGSAIFVADIGNADFKLPSDYGKVGL